MGFPDFAGPVVHRYPRRHHESSGALHGARHRIPFRSLLNDNRYVRRTCPFRHASHRGAASRPLPRRPQELGPPAARVSLPFLRRRLARADHQLRQPAEHREGDLGHGHRLACSRRRSQPGDAVHPVACPRARRTAPADVDDDAARLAGTGADLQGPAGKAGRQGPDHLRFPRLSAADERRHPDLPRRQGAGRRGPDSARRIHPRAGAPLQPHVRSRTRFRGQGARRGQEAGRQEGSPLRGAAHALPAGG
ncbi:hypothetical protein SDC9_171278 [bioreactor metagenome]|uniref:Uncharacterized protein n=1 Tax=bioreactor metagenome TaxID=1076179 RepID=A0A645GB73_9ZZZZ